MTNLALALAAAIALNQSSLAAQTNAVLAPPPAPSAGLINDLLRKQSDAFTDWDLGGQVRARYDMKQNFATPGLAGAIDFRDKGGNPHNDYLLMVKLRKQKLNSKSPKIITKIMRVYICSRLSLNSLYVEISKLP